MRFSHAFAVALFAAALAACDTSRRAAWPLDRDPATLLRAARVHLGFGSDAARAVIRFKGTTALSYARDASGQVEITLEGSSAYHLRENRPRLGLLDVHTASHGRTLIAIGDGRPEYASGSAERSFVRNWARYLLLVTLALPDGCDMSFGSTATMSASTYDLVINGDCIDGEILSIDRKTLLPDSLRFRLQKSSGTLPRGSSQAALPPPQTENVFGRLSTADHRAVGDVLLPMHFVEQLGDFTRTIEVTEPAAAPVALAAGFAP